MPPQTCSPLDAFLYLTHRVELPLEDILTSSDLVLDPEDQPGIHKILHSGATIRRAVADAKVQK